MYKTQGPMIGIAVLLMTLLLGPTVANGQSDDGPPPLPVIFSGEVYVNGMILEEGTGLTVRVGEWEGRPVMIKDGNFLALIAGPPSVGYTNQPITFHLDGMEANERYIFSLQETPSSQWVRLEFQNASLPSTPTQIKDAPEIVYEATATPVENTATATFAESTFTGNKAPSEPFPTPQENTSDPISGLDTIRLGLLLGGGIILLIALRVIFSSLKTRR